MPFFTVTVGGAGLRMVRLVGEALRRGRRLSTVMKSLEKFNGECILI